MHEAKPKGIKLKRTTDNIKANNLAEMLERYTLYIQSSERKAEKLIALPVTKDNLSRRVKLSNSYTFWKNKAEELKQEIITYGSTTEMES